jgi:ribosomal protein S18 acetylase RimI-like enzyme
MNTNIKRMTELDDETLVYLLKRAGEQNPKPNAGFFKDGKNILLVSRTDGELSGFLWANVLERPGSLRPKMLLYSIDVFEEYRRLGIATLLIAELKHLAAKYNCTEIFVPTGKSNTAAVGLYRKTGGLVEADDDAIFIYREDTLRL